MNTTQNTKTKRLIAALGVAAAAAVAPALLFAGAGTAHADDECYGSLAFSYYCSPAGGGLTPPVFGPNPSFGDENLIRDGILNPARGPIDPDYRGNTPIQWPWDD
jgi:hypothetical protein